MRPGLEVYHGPSRKAPFAAVVAEFDTARRQPLPVGDAAAAMAALLPEELDLAVAWPRHALALHELALCAAVALRDPGGPSGLRHAATALPPDTARIALGFRDPDSAALALGVGIGLAEAIFDLSAGRAVARAAVADMVRRCVEVTRRAQPDPFARALMRVCDTRGIPVYPVAAGSKVWSYGQGSHATQFFEAATHRDSLTGLYLSRDKQATSRFIRRLGLPGVEHVSAPTEDAALDLAGRMGYPLVVKPAAAGKGRGVTAGVAEASQVGEAFRRARAVGRGAVLIERFISGDDHRLSVFGGQLRRASMVLPPRILGDGTSTIGALVAAENRRRAGVDIATALTAPIRIDAEVDEQLARQGLTMDHVPAAGETVVLRRNSNLSTGGTLLDVTDRIHPENRSMAEAIARAFHLDAAGIDFITPDIGRSWREIDCAVIEVNATPGIGDLLASRILEAKFPEGSDGRVPSVLLVGASDAMASEVTQAFAMRGLRVGATGRSGTSLGAERRFADAVLLTDRVLGLLLDPACDALVVGCDNTDLGRFGVPHGRFDLALVADPDALTRADFDLLDATCASVVAPAGRDRLADAAGQAVTVLVSAASSPAGRP